MTILNACTKMSGNLLNASHILGDVVFLGILEACFGILISLISLWFFTEQWLLPAEAWSQSSLSSLVCKSFVCLCVSVCDFLLWLIQLDHLYTFPRLSITSSMYPHTFLFKVLITHVNRQPLYKFLPFQ